MRKFCAAILSLALLVSLCPFVAVTPVYAATADPGITPLWDQILYCSADLTIDANGTAQLHCIGYGNADTTKVIITAKLQRSRGLFWTTVETFSTESNLAAATLNESYNVDAGYSYRIKLTVTVYSGTSSESDTVKSNTVEY